MPARWNALQHCYLLVPVSKPEIGLDLCFIMPLVLIINPYFPLNIPLYQLSMKHLIIRQVVLQISLWGADLVMKKILAHFELEWRICDTRPKRLRHHNDASKVAFRTTSTHLQGLSLPRLRKAPRKTINIY